MKKAFFSTFAAFVLLIAACNTKPEKNSEASTDENYLQVPVGENNHGEFIINNLEIIQKEWEKRLSQEKKGLLLKDFKIIEGTTTGDAAQKYYMLVASSTNGNVKTASLLTLKGNRFYFELQQGEDGSDFYLNISCEGSCVEGCGPIVTISNGSKFINCSQCDDCTKNGVEMR